MLSVQLLYFISCAVSEPLLFDNLIPVVFSVASYVKQSQSAFGLKFMDSADSFSTSSQFS
jgi:hypothetical protein